MPRRVTNNFNLPAPVVAMVDRNTYTQGDTDVNVTTFIAPPQVTILKEAHKDNLVVDASDLLYPAWGSTLHEVLFRYGERADDAVVEEFLTTTDRGIKWGGHIDLREPSLRTANAHTIADYKMCNTFKAMKVLKGGTNDKEWEQQLNCYCLLVRRAYPDLEIDALQVIAFLRDWSKTKAQGADYPPTGVMPVPIPLWSEQEQEAFVDARLSLWEAQQLRMDAGDPLIPCTDEERWMRPGAWRVKARTNGKTRRKFDNEMEAKEMVEKDPEKFYIDVTPGIPLRCTHYCDAATYCDQYQTELNHGESK